MTIDEAIENEAIEKARNNAVIQRNNQKLNYTLGKSSPYYNLNCDKYAEYHEQIAEWLEELKSYRASVFSGDMTQKMLKEEYCKAVDDFASKLIMHFADWKLSNAPYNDDETDRIREIICETIENAIGGVEEIAEQLKAGDRE